MNILRAGGGTGGHAFPIKSMISFIDKYHPQESVNHYWTGSKGSLEEKLCRELCEKISNLLFLPLFSGKWRRESSFLSFLSNLIDLFFFGIGVFQGIYYILRYHIDVIFCKGGYVALPVVIAGAILRRRIIVHESDTHAGLVNRIASRLAEKSFVAFPSVLKDEILVGQILSEELLFQDYKLIKNLDKTQVLVMGGSQGARVLYEALLQLLNEEERLADFNFIVILGQLNQDLKPLFSGFDFVEIKDFCSQSEIGALYEISDLVITRSGTTSLAEQDLFGLKMIMVPLPWTHDQKNNAQWYVDQHKGILIEQDNEHFIDCLRKVLLEHIGWHKKERNLDRLKHISQVKERIADAILY